MNRYFKIIREFTVRGRRPSAFTALIVGICLAAPTPSQAITTGICGPVHALTAVGFGDLGDQIGFCETSVTLSEDHALLTITLTNTSPVDNGGFIVAAAFSLPAGTTADFTSTDPDFVISLNGAVVVAPFENRTAIISLGGTLENAFETFGALVPPTLGIGVGDSVTFEFDLEGATGPGVTEQGIFDSQLVRFSGFVTHDPGDRTSVSANTNTHPVPEPSTFWLLGTALIGGGFWSRRRMIVKSVLRRLS